MDRVFRCQGRGSSRERTRRSRREISGRLCPKSRRRPLRRVGGRTLLRRDRASPFARRLLPSRSLRNGNHSLHASRLEVRREDGRAYHDLERHDRRPDWEGEESHCAPGLSAAPSPKDQAAVQDDGRNLVAHAARRAAHRSRQLALNSLRLSRAAAMLGRAARGGLRGLSVPRRSLSPSARRLRGARQFRRRHVLGREGAFPDGGRDDGRARDRRRGDVREGARKTPRPVRGLAHVDSGRGQVLLLLHPPLGRTRR